jgi:transforming growth factor-beta-induced protein
MEDHMRRLTLALLAGSLLIGLVAAPVSARRAGPSIVDTAIAVNAATGEFSTLIAALQAANLVGALDGNRQFTVFAPTDAAFAALGLNADNIGTLDDTALTNILLYHVTAGRKDSGDVVAADSLRMLNGQRADVEVDGSSVTIDGAPIVDVDIRTSNGIIHVVGGVLLP